MAVTGEEVTIREHENPADAALQLGNVVFPLMTIIGSVRVLSFLVVAIRSIRFMKALPLYTGAHGDMNRKKKKTHKNLTKNVLCMPTKLFCT